MSENDLPYGVTIKGGIGSGKLTRTISRLSQSGASKTEFTFTCGGMDSGFKTTVYVYNAKVDKVFLEMQWDGSGNLFSSNVYNWATRVRVIGYGNTNSPPTSVMP